MGRSDDKPTFCLDLLLFCAHNGDCRQNQSPSPKKHRFGLYLGRFFIVLRAFFAIYSKSADKFAKILLLSRSTKTMSRPEKTEISNDGLRYKSKKGGSPFEGLGRTGDTMSCIKCGVHKPRNNGSFKRILGSSMFVCFDCSPPKKDAAPAAPADAASKVKA